MTCLKNMPRHHAPRGQHGFTLVEVLVAMTIGMLILLGLTTLFANNSRNHAELERTSRQLESARFALDTLANDMRHAGYLGEFNPNDLGPTVTTPDDACVTSTASFGWNTAGVAVSLPAALRGIGSAESISCLTDRYRLDGTEAITVRHVNTSEETLPASVVPGNLYVQVSRCSTDIRQIVAGSAATDFTLKNIACTAAVNAVRRYIVRTYYIASCNECEPSDGIPTLKRVEMINGALRTTALAEGIENLQIEYGIDSTASMDGRPDEFITAAEVDGTPVARAWQNVVSARVHMLSRNTEKTGGYADPRTYRMGQVTVVPANSSATAPYKRTLMTETVRLVNQGDRYDK
jgi:type IV pilus assembly protein PilW